MLVPDPSLQHVLGRLDLVVARAEQEVARRRAGDPAPDDRWRGLYFSDAELERLAGASPAVGLGDPGDALAARRDAVEAEADRALAAGHDLRLRRLAAVARLTPLDEELLVLALALSTPRRRRAGSSTRRAGRSRLPRGIRGRRAAPRGSSTQTGDRAPRRRRRSSTPPRGAPTDSPLRARARSSTRGPVDPSASRRRPQARSSTPTAVR